MQTQPNATFSLSRFYRLRRLADRDSRKAMAICTAATAFFYLYIGQQSFSLEPGEKANSTLGMLTLLLFFVLIALVSYLASSGSNHLKEKDSACHALMLPARRSEKFGVIWFFYGLILPLFLWVLTAFVGLMLYLSTETFHDFITHIMTKNAFSSTKGIILFALVMLFNQSYFALGGILFKKQALAKLIFGIVGLCLLIFLIDLVIPSKFGIMNAMTDLFKGALSEDGYGQNFWLAAGILGSGSFVFASVLWQKLKHYAMP